MSLWEYKVISSGKGGFATPALLEKFLNDLGRDEWEIIEFRTAQDNALAFSGLARRTTQRDWTLQDAAAAAAKAEAEKLRAEFEAKFKAATVSGPASGGGGEERSPSFLEEKAAPDDGLRKLVDTSQDGEPEPAEEEEDEWDKLTAAEQEELPTFFEAIKPHMRRNQRGPGMSVGVDYLAKKWDQSEEDLTGALVECGFVMPEDEDSKAEYLEYDGDLYWLNINRRGELWINTKEKPRPVFRAVKAQRAVVEEEPKPEKQDRGQRHERGDRGQKSEKSEKSENTGEAKPETEGSAQSAEGGGEVATSAGEATAATGEAPAASGEGQSGGGGGKSQGPELPQGSALLAKIRPHMRRNRRGPGGSGSASFLARALRRSEAEIKEAFVALGLTVPASPNDKAVYSEFGEELWWLNLDSRGGLWINGREKKRGETVAGANAAPTEAPAAGTSENTAPAAPETAPAGDAAASVVATSTDGAPASATAAAATEASPAAGVVSDSTPKPEAAATEPVSVPAAVEPTPAPTSSESERQREAAPQPAVTPVAAPAELAPIAETKSEPAAPAAGESAAVAEEGAAKEEGDAAGKSDDEADGSPEKEKKPRRPRTKKKAE